jgi:mRNA interferase MazF
MGEFVKGDVIVIPFPFSDLSAIKRRPALVIANPKGNDIISCQITSQFHNDKYSIILENKNFETGTLNQISYIRPNKLITIDNSIVLYKVGELKKEIFNNVINKIIEIIKS